MGLTLYDKIWEAHVVANDGQGTDLIYIDRHLVPEGTSPQAFNGLRESGRRVRCPGLTLAVADHNPPSDPQARRAGRYINADAQRQVETIERNSREFGLTYLGPLDPRQGITHVVAPEYGMTHPGTVIVCGDSHTATHGAFGALAFGIGTSEVEHVLATQTLWQRRSKRLRVRFDGPLRPGVYAKDMILALIGRIGTAGATGHVIEYAGEAIEALSMEGRMTVCNMSIEAGARAGMVAPDGTTLAYLKGRPSAPQDGDWDRAAEAWLGLRSDPDAVFDRELAMDASAIEPQVTWGTSPQDVVPIGGQVPDPADEADPARRAAIERSLRYMGLMPGTAMVDIAIERVFIGSCTNGRIEDLRVAAAILDGRHVASGVELLVVPGSGAVKRQAEQEGLDRIVKAAGGRWHEPGCSMCLAQNGDMLHPGERCASTSNRNFQGRQGRGGRTHLVSPAMAATAAVAGHFEDARTQMR